MKKISLAVTDFAVPCPRRGSIDSYSGFSRGATVGVEIHQRVQSQRAKDNSGYTAEVPAKFVFERGGFTFEVSGRMDGVFTEGHPRIEEIKTNFNIYELRRYLNENEDHPYILQLQTYGYFFFQQNQKKPELNLCLVSSRNGDSSDFHVSLDINDYEKWLNLRLDELVEEAKLAEKRAARRRRAATSMAFPFAKPREGQIDLIQTIEEGLQEQRPMLIQAPTGLGKTVGVLYPSLKEALARGQKVAYLTPKNSQHQVAEDAIERLQESGAQIRGMTLTAKKKMCFKNEPICNPDFCEYAKDHYTKMAENRVVEELSAKRKLTARTFKKIAEKHQVCPFEIQIEAAQTADIVICDYNYVFGPRSALSRWSGLEIDQDGKPNVVVDEVHNLPARAMDYYSPALSTATLEKMRPDIQKIPKRFRAEANLLLDACIKVIRRCGPKDAVKTVKIDPPASAFLEQDNELRTFLSNYLAAEVEIQADDVVMRLSYYWSEFSAALEYVKAKPFFTTFQPNPAAVKITCCDASEMLKERYDGYQNFVGFSATLKPFEYYEQLIGLKEKNIKTAEFVSPFPHEHRKVLIIPQISSKYSQREKNYPRIAEAIAKISALRPGNYFAFFPSFDFMEKVVSQFKPLADFTVLRQERYMKRDAVEDTLELLKVPAKNHIIFAVQGGIFSEGVDYPGNMMIGAFVVGPPLPNFDLEREEMRKYYETHYQAGFDYAYTYPAMAKAVQAAGRVIRSENDHGLIVLMDNRFIQPSYVKSMPQDWYKESPRELVSEKILKDVDEFWANLTSKNQNLDP